MRKIGLLIVGALSATALTVGVSTAHDAHEKTKCTGTLNRAPTASSSSPSALPATGPMQRSRSATGSRSMRVARSFSEASRARTPARSATASVRWLPPRCRSTSPTSRAACTCTAATGSSRPSRTASSRAARRSKSIPGSARLHPQQGSRRCEAPRKRDGRSGRERIRHQHDQGRSRSASRELACTAGGRFAGPAERRERQRSLVSAPLCDLRPVDRPEGIRIGPIGRGANVLIGSGRVGGDPAQRQALAREILRGGVAGERRDREARRSEPTSAALLRDD